MKSILVPLQGLRLIFHARRTMGLEDGDKINIFDYCAWFNNYEEGKDFLRRFKDIMNLIF
jgi:hypothetical protein